MVLDNGTLYLIIGFCAAWAAAVIFVALVIGWQIVARMQPRETTDKPDAWRDM